MFHVYILRGSNGRHYIGQTENMGVRLAQRRAGHTHTTRRLGNEIELITTKSVDSRTAALTLERKLKSWKNSTKVIEFLRSTSG